MSSKSTQVIKTPFDEDPRGWTLEDILRDIPDFKPTIRYDKRLDTLRVHLQDCSILERQVEGLEGIVTIYYDNSTGAEKVVGFAIEDVSALLR